MKISDMFEDRRTPLKIIEWIISIVTIIGGLYVVSPLLSYSTANFGAGAIAQTIAHPIGILIFGVIFLVSGLLLAYGLLKDIPKVRSFALMMMIACRTYSLIGTWITIGFLPLTYLSNVALIFIAVVVYLVIRWEQKE